MGSPSYEELQRKRAEKKKLETKPGEAEEIGQTEEQAPEVQGQRKQPKKKKKKR